MPLPLARCAFSRSPVGTSTVILRAVSMTPEYTIPGTSIEYGLAGHRQQPPFVRRRAVYHGRKPTLSVHSSASLGLWPLGVVLVFELLSGFLAIECPIDRDAISVGSPVPGAGFRPENPDLAESALPQTLLGKEADLQFRLIQ